MVVQVELFRTFFDRNPVHDLTALIGHYAKNELVPIPLYSPASVTAERWTVNFSGDGCLLRIPGGA